MLQLQQEHAIPASDNLGTMKTYMLLAVNDESMKKDGEKQV
jgi:hypothetical protein